mmetsp:Transcript_21542/g.19106  ORF Transcript_21542/g.19106 Transcript_21542/m.19106 type:complete len:166 (+) Transcript_21542:921-1418(+)
MLQRKLHGWYGALRLSPLDGKLNRNYVPMGKAGYIGASETLHNKSKLLMKKPKDFLLFGNMPLNTSILKRLENQKSSSNQLPDLHYKKKHFASTMTKTEKQISAMDDLYIKGTSKFESEIEYGLRIPEKERILIKDREQAKAERIMIEENPEEVLETQFDGRTLY